MILKLGMHNLGLKLYKLYINDDPGLTLTFLRQGQIWSPVRLNGGKLLQSHLMVESLKQRTRLTFKNLLQN